MIAQAEQFAKYLSMPSHVVAKIQSLVFDRKGSDPLERGDELVFVVASWLLQWNLFDLAAAIQILRQHRASLAEAGRTVLESIDNTEITAPCRYFTIADGRYFFFDDKFWDTAECRYLESIQRPTWFLQASPELLFLNYLRLVKDDRHAKPDDSPAAGG